MSNPRSIAQVTTAASALEGAGVTMDVSNAGLFVTNQLVELYPQQHGDGAPLARAGQTVRYLITAIAGAQLTGTMNVDAYANPPQVEAGWIIDGRSTSLSGLGGGGNEVLVPSEDYPATTAGIQAAIDAAALLAGTTGDSPHPVWVVIGPGLGDIVVSTPLVRATNVGVKTMAGTRLVLPATAATTQIFANSTTFSAGRTLAANANRNTSAVTLIAGSVTALGLAAGDLVVIADPTTAVRVQVCRVRSANSGTDVVEFWDALSSNFLGPASDLIYKFTGILVNSPLEVECDGNGNTGGNGTTPSAAVFVYGHAFCEYSRCKFSNFSGNGTYGGAIRTIYGYRNTYRDLTDYESGSSGYAGLGFNFEWLGHWDNLFSQASAFAQEWSDCGLGKVFHCVSEKAASRGLKFQNCRDFDTFGIEGNNTRSGGSGIMCGTGPHQYNLTHHGPVARGCPVGMQTDGTGNRFVRFIDPVVEGNTVQIWLVAGDADLEVINPGLATASITGVPGVLFDSTGRVRGVGVKDATVGAAAGTIFTPIGPFTTAGRRGTVHVRASAIRTSGGAANDGIAQEAVASFTPAGQTGATASLLNVGAGGFVGMSLAYAGNPYFQFNGVAGTNANWQGVYDAEIVGP